jgi:branched-chain amino acid transport system ATP-binding protein
MPILEGQRVTKFFGGLAAVVDVDFKVEQGEVLGLIGPNGAGKTTLFNLISAALVPKPGKIMFKGKNITGLKPYQICRMGVARTFQTVKVFPDAPVIDNVLLGSFFGKVGKKAASKARADAFELIEFVGLTDVIDTPAGDLTLSNQKRLEIARALATMPDILMLDEVMEGLNPTEVSQAMELVTRIRERGITIIMIEHIMKAIMNICDRIMVLHYGAKIADGTPEEIANNEQVIKVYLGDKAHAGS